VAGKLRQGSRWLVPSLFAAGCGTLVTGGFEARRALGDGDVLEALATLGFIALVALPALIAASALARGVWAAWAPRDLRRTLVDDHGGAPRLAAWLLALSLAALALAWSAFQGVWLLANHTAFKPIGVGFVEPAIVVATCAGLAIAIVPAVRLFAYLFAHLEAEWRRATGGRPLLTPWRLAWLLIALAIVAVELIWRFGVKPKIGPFDTAEFDAPLLGATAWAIAHVAGSALPRRALATAAVATAALAVAASGVAMYALDAEPSLTLAIWGDRPVAGFAIDSLFDLDDIRAGMSLAEFQPVEKPDSPHPDIILVTIDTVRADHTPPYNPAMADMPVLKQLGKLGAVFDWAFSPSNVTRRSVPSLIIGLEANRVHGRVVGWALRVDPRHVLLPERLAAGGYDTAGFMCCEGFWGKTFHTGLQRGLDYLEIESNGHELARKARVWVEERERGHPDKPLFIWMHILEPHNWTVASGEGRNDQERKQFYDRSLSASDAMLGELLNAFSHRAPAKAPIVIVTADHGEGLGEHGHPYHSTDLYDSQTHVPLVMAGPGIKPGHIAETVSLVDLVPTVLELAGFVPPTDHSLDGRSLADLATGKRPGYADGGTAYAVMVQDRSNPGGIEMMVRGRWKLIENEGASTELYDTRSDPDEHFNLFTQKPGIAAELKRLLDEHHADGDVSPFE
jgi:arylsulfatase A-like enzyme